jgi:ribulose-5-phosphate 4-epimerase/fuculose-1-phosphate aldolase
MGASDFRSRIATCMNVLVAHGQLPFGAGHVSARAPEAQELYIIGHLHMLDERPRELGPEYVIRIGAAGDVLEGQYEPPDEFHIHAAIYAARPDVGGIAHTHPQSVIVAAAAGLEIFPLDVWSAVFSPRVPVLGFPESTHGATRKRGDAIAAALGSSSAVVMKGHGAVAVASTPEEACVVSLCLERAADMRLQIAPADPEPFPASEIVDGVPRGLGGEELFRTAWSYFSTSAER